MRGLLWTLWSLCLLVLLGQAWGVVNAAEDACTIDDMWGRWGDRSWSWLPPGEACTYRVVGTDGSVAGTVTISPGWGWTGMVVLLLMCLYLLIAWTPRTRVLVVAGRSRAGRANGTVPATETVSDYGDSWAGRLAHAIQRCADPRFDVRIEVTGADRLVVRFRYPDYVPMAVVVSRELLAHAEVLDPDRDVDELAGFVVALGVEEPRGAEDFDRDLDGTWWLRSRAWIV